MISLDPYHHVVQYVGAQPNHRFPGYVFRRPSSLPSSVSYLLEGRLCILGSKASG